MQRSLSRAGEAGAEIRKKKNFLGMIKTRNVFYRLLVVFDWKKGSKCK